MIEISIIIPVYKAEQYLRRCLDSIINQTFTDFEVILIDDGSPDLSGVICDEYAKKDKRFIVVHKENGGLPSARAVGVEKARGNYSIQFDPDDWIEQTMLSMLHQKAIEDNADIVICDFFKNFKSSTVIVSHNNRPSDRNDIYDDFLTGRMQASFWNKLVRHSLYKEKSIVFNKELTRWEDVYVICCLMEDIGTISFVDKPLYHYDLHSNPNSMIRNATEQGLRSQLFVTDFFYKKYRGTVHECALINMRISTKNLAYLVINTSNYINLYSDCNKKIVRLGISGKAGISGLFMALTIMTRSSLFQIIYKLLINYFR